MNEETVEYIVKVAGGEPTVVTVTERDILYPEQFLSPKEIALDIFRNRMSAADLHQFFKTSEDMLITLHLNFGMWIRNAYGLWIDNNPHTSLEDSRSDRFPDQVSQYIIETLHKSCQVNDIYDKESVIENIERNFNYE